MSQTNKPIKEREDETLVLLDIAKAIEEVKHDGYGMVVVYVRQSKIERWERVKSETRRNYLRHTQMSDIDQQNQPDSEQGRYPLKKA